MCLVLTCVRFDPSLLYVYLQSLIFFSNHLLFLLNLQSIQANNNKYNNNQNHPQKIQHTLSITEIDKEMDDLMKLCDDDDDLI